MKIKLTVLAFFISMLLTGQVLAFDLQVGDLRYDVINATDVKVLGHAWFNTATDIVIPDTVVDSGTTYSVTTIDLYAFNTRALTSVIIGNSVTTIGNYAFNTSGLTSVIIPDSVTTIGSNAFNNNALTSVIIPDSVTTIGASAFRNNALTSVIIPDSVTAIKESTFRNNALTSVIIPDSVTVIWVNAFYNNRLGSVIIPDSVTTIGQGAFNNNALTSVIIPNSVTAIGYDSSGAGLAGAFQSNALTSVAFEGDFGSFVLDMFLNNPALATITYCDVKTGWPQGFNNGSTIVVTTPIACSPPDAPTIDSIVAGNAQATITVTPGADNGSPITGYTAYCFGDTFNLDASPTSPVTVSGLTNGVSHVCAVTAANDGGTSPPSAVSAPFTPVGPPPGC